MNRPPARVALVVVTFGIGALLWRIHSPSHTVSVPFSYTPASGAIRYRIEINGVSRVVEMNTLRAKTELSRPLFEALARKEHGIDQLSPPAEFRLDEFRARLFVAPEQDAAGAPRADGIAGVDLFSPAAAFDGRNARAGARVTLDFRSKMMTVDYGASAGLAAPPSGTLELRLIRGDDGLTYVDLPLNYGAPRRFALGIGCRQTLLPTGAVVYPSPDATGYVNAVGTVPVNLEVDHRDLTDLAAAPPIYLRSGVLGMSLLANFRVVIDFRRSRLYLEPPDSP